MLHNWTQGSVLHLSKLQTLNIEEHFQYSLFPKFKLEDHPRKAYAVYFYKNHEIIFNKTMFMNYLSSFTHTYFHELIHSTAKHNNRFDRLIHTQEDYSDIYNLEERIADIGGLALARIFDAGFKYGNPANLKKILKAHPTNYALPWQEIEDSVLLYLNNKDCNKVKETLQLYKRTIIEDGFNVYEGYFNGTK